MSAWSQTVTGRAIHYNSPDIRPEHLFTEVAHALAQANRFNGHTPSPFSVAQHSVQMAEAALDETGDPELAAFCLLHDGHEAYLGDTTSPVKDAISEEVVALALEVHGQAAPGERAAILANMARKRMEQRFDAAIMAAAGLSHARYRTRKVEVVTYDLRALLTERRDLMRAAPQPWAIDERTPRLTPLRLRGGSIKPVVPIKAMEAFITTLKTLCPDAARAAGRA